MTERKIRDIERLGLAIFIGSLSRTRISPGRRRHPGESCKHGAEGTGHKGYGSSPGDENQEQDKHGGYKKDEHRIFSLQKGHCSRVDHSLQILHELGAIRLFLHIDIDKVRDDQP
jgi:hypothetical protein